MSDDGAIRSTSQSPHHHSPDEITPTSTIVERKEDPPKKMPFEESIKPEATHAEPDFPDGGWRAWLVVFGVISMCRQCAIRFQRTLPADSYGLPADGSFKPRKESKPFGFVNSWGTFQAYYQQNTLRDSSPSNIAWIGSIQYSLVFLPGIFLGRLFDLGHFKSIFLTSSAILVTSTFLIAECTKYWQFLLCQGFAAGLACGGIFGPTTAVVSHWFKCRRGIAMGFVAIGSSIGGTIIPITAHKLIPLVGYQWAMRTIGFILLFVLGMANLTLKRRLPAINSPGGLLNLKAFRSAPFTFYTMSAFTTFLGIYTVLTYVGISALTLGISPDLSFYLVAIANASSLFGRYTSGALSDRVGPMNVMIPFTVAAGILTYAWPFARSQESLIAVIILYGFSSGAYLSLISNPMMALGETDDVGRRLGMFMSIFSIGALAGPPISGAINKASGGFEVVGYYAGSMIMLGVVLMCITRHLVLQHLIGIF